MSQSIGSELHPHPHTEAEHDHGHSHVHSSGHDHPHPHGADGQGHPHPHDHGHDHPHGAHDHAPAPAHAHEDGCHEHGHSHGEAHAHNHEAEHDHDPGHDHDHASPKNPWQWLLAIFHLGPYAHDHDHGAIAGSILQTSARGMWAIKWSFIGLMMTAAMQVVIVYFSGSVALLADTIHNFGDAATAVPLWIAFTLARRPASRRYTYGYARAEDLAGVAVVLLILFSAAVAGYEAIDHLIHPRVMTNIGWVVAAAVIGFIGNEAVAVFRTKVGREIGSAALIADGQHARIDGLTSLAVLVGAIGAWLGFPLADPLIGLLISLAIVRIAWGATKSMWYRMMDAAEPVVTDTLERTARDVPGVLGTHCARVRWVGHRLHGELHIEVDPQIGVSRAHEISEEVQHALFHALPRLCDVAIHIDLWGTDQAEFHQLTMHHRDAAT